MDNQKNSIPPNKENIIILLMCSLLACILIILDYKPNLPTIVDPIILLIICVIALCAETKTVHLNAETLCVKYHILFINRKIVWERIQNVEFISMRSRHYLIFSLDNCPPYVGSNRSLSTYVLLHLIKAIVIEISEKEKASYLELVKYFCPKAVTTDNFPN